MPGRRIQSNSCSILRIHELFFKLPVSGVPMLSTRASTERRRSLQSELSVAIQRWTLGKEDVRTAIPNLLLFRRERIGPPCACTVEPSIVVVVQGAKQLLIGGQPYVYNAQHFLLTSLDLPGSSQVLEANPQHPCLGMGLRLNLRLLTELIPQIKLPPTSLLTSDGSAALGPTTSVLLEPFNRLLSLLDEPHSIPFLAPQIEREILYRLLISEQAARLWQIASVGTQSHRIARVIEWMKTCYNNPLRIDDVAAYAQMSTSSLHHHFRQLTTMSPLQYLKWLRLNEARRMMLNENLDAASAAFQVGYESPSHFSRDYSRFFGSPPRRDIEGLRQKSMLNVRLHP